jgi:hypothetical protein
MTVSRLLVQRAVADQFRTLITQRLQNVKARPASDPSSDMGPLIDKANFQSIEIESDNQIQTLAPLSTSPPQETYILRKSLDKIKHQSRRYQTYRKAISIGLSLLVNTIRMFAIIGRGTLAPWDSTLRLVVKGSIVIFATR